MSFKRLNPEAIRPPFGPTHGLLTTSDVRLLFIAGQIGWDESQKLVSDDFVDQFDRALRNVLAVALEAGGAPGGIARLVIYVTDKEEYRARRQEIGVRWREQM